jgi:hypothetical protein
VRSDAGRNKTLNVKIAQLNYYIKDHLPLSYGRKLRGFFAHKFPEVLFHHHKKDDTLRYKYPLIQYKIIGNPKVVGINQGADLLTEKFLDIDYLELGDKRYNHPKGNINVQIEELKITDTTLPMLKYKYTFLSPWMGLNQKNYRTYTTEVADKGDEEHITFFSPIIIGNILSFAKGIDWWIKETIKVVPKLEPVKVNLKRTEMIGFKGAFYSNIALPDYIGIGKSCSRGFGTITKEELF